MHGTQGYEQVSVSVRRFYGFSHAIPPVSATEIEWVQSYDSLCLCSED
jgi:hypothetical protein